MVWEKTEMQSHEKCRSEVLSKQSWNTHQNAQPTAQDSYFQATYPSEMLHELNIHE